MTEHIDLNRIPVEHIARTPAPVEIGAWEEEPPQAGGYDRFTTMTLQSTLVSLRATTAIHGQTARTRQIEAAISAELRMREEPTG